MPIAALVTGGAGFIGSNVVDLLLDRGARVTVFDNLTSGYRENVSPAVRFVEGDVRDPHAVLRAMQGVDVVFHLAASVGNARGLENPSSDATANALGTLNVVEAARLSGCRHVVYSSSAAIFGEPQRLPVDAAHPTRPLTPYAVSKLAGEHYVLAYGTLYGIIGVCLRYFNVYGIRQRFDAYGNVIPIFATRALRGEELTIFGDGEQTRDFVNVRDVARANLLASEAKASGAYNVGSGVAVTVNQLADAILRATGARVAVRHGPERPGDVRHSAADIGATMAAIGYQPTVTLADGLVSYVAWLREEMGGRRR